MNSLILGLWLATQPAVPASSEMTWVAIPLCEGEKMIGLRIPVPAMAPPGLAITILFDPATVCKEPPPPEQRRQPSSRTSRLKL